MQSSAKTAQEAEQDVALKYKQLQQETQVLVSRILEIDDERKENVLVLDAIKELEDTRKCWRLVNGVLFEKTKVDLVPELETEIANIQNVIDQLSNALEFKK